MICSNCGNNAPEGATICPRCGTPLGTSGSQTVKTSYQPAGELPTTTSVLVMGIIAAVLAWFPCTSIAGIVLGAIGRNKARAYVNLGGIPSGKIKAGSITSNVGFIAGIIMTAIWLIYFCVVGCAVGMAGL